MPAVAPAEVKSLPSFQVDGVRFHTGLRIGRSEAGGGVPVGGHQDAVGASRKSWVSGLKARPYTATVRPASGPSK